MSEFASNIVTVEILGQRYPIRSALDPVYVSQLAGYVDAKMQAAMNENPSADSLRIAVLAALNIADEFFRSRETEDADDEALARRTAELERLIDRALAFGRE
ncbi:MAG: cell division protein ZapA [Vicinamibacterales bacterium]